MRSELGATRPMVRLSRWRPAAVRSLLVELRALIDVRYTAMPDLVARLDMEQDGWVLHLDPDSPPEDLCWAMLDVLGLLTGPSSGVRRAATPRLPRPRTCLPVRSVPGADSAWA